MVVHTHRDVGSVGDYDICTAAQEIVGVAASEQATAIAFDEASRRGVYLVAFAGVERLDCARLPGDRMVHLAIGGRKTSR